VSEAERVDDGGEEILECLREERHMLEQYEDVDAIVPEGKLETSEERNVVGFVGFFCVIYEAPFCEISFLVGKPL
jgi:hypothetical protein